MLPTHRSDARGRRGARTSAPVETLAQRLGTEPRLLVARQPRAPPGVVRRRSRRCSTPPRALRDARDQPRARSTSRSSASTGCRRSPVPGRRGGRPRRRSPPPRRSGSTSTARAGIGAGLRAHAGERALASCGSPAPSTASLSRSSSLRLACVSSVSRARLQRLGEALAFLTRTAPDLPERQRSLRAAIDWSVRLLGPPAPHVLAVLAAFPAGATLDALEAVADPSTDVAAGARRAPGRRASSPRRSPAAPSRASRCSRRSARMRSRRSSLAERVEELRRRQLAWCIALAEDDRAALVGARHSLARPHRARAGEHRGCARLRARVRRRGERASPDGVDAPLLARARPRRRGAPAAGGGADARRPRRALPARTDPLRDRGDAHVGGRLRHGTHDVVRCDGDLRVARGRRQRRPRPRGARQPVERVRGPAGGDRARHGGRTPARPTRSSCT